MKLVDKSKDFNAIFDLNRYCIFIIKKLLRFGFPLLKSNKSNLYLDIIY